ncbi:hypothetical protein Tco_1005885 [Tanacetum coccineum]|uniref:Uncharacterized protein n=1 Tax=Tanacetum coccineum TaxID=301880 RepID=A0ABQ5FI35_9ASTR
MNTLSEETPRVKSSGSAGGKNRRISIGIKTSGKSSGEEVNSVPNYLRASTGSCHDIRKYGKHHEHVKSAIPIKFKRTTVVDKEKVAKTVVPVEKKKTTTVKPSPVTVNRDVSAGLNSGTKKKQIKTVNKAEATPKRGPAKKRIPKDTLTDSRSQKASFSRAESLKAIKSKSAKQVAPLKDQNRMQKSVPKQTSSDKVQTQALQVGEAESEVYIESIKFDFLYSSMELKDPPACDSSLVQIEALDGFETEHEVTLETMEFDFILPSMELINPPVCNESEPFSCNDIGEEESFITYTVSERSELIPDEEPLEESLIAPLVVESSHASSDKEESLIAPPVSECTEDEGVLEDESEYTDDHNEEVEVSEDNAKSSDKEKEVSAAQNDEMDTPSEETPRVKSAILPSMELVNPSVCNEFEPFSWYDIGEEESFIWYTVNERSELIPDEELPENSTIMPTVIESSHASSDKEESLIAPPVSECTEDEGVLEDESEYTDDHNEEVEVSEDNEKEVAAAQNDEMDTPSEDVSDETPRVNSAVLPSIELVNPPVCNESEPFSWDDIGEEESFITYTVNERSELIPHEEPLENEGVLEDESEYTDDHNEEVEVSEDNEKEVAAAQNDEMDTPSEDVSDETPRVNSAVLPSIELVNPPVCNESEPFSWDDIGEEESFITYTVNERSELIPDKEPLEESLIAPLVVESSHASSDKEESLIAPPVSECTEDEGVLEDESEYTDDHNEEVEVSEDNEKEVAAAQNDEMDTPSEDVSDETPRVNSAVLPSIELVNPPVCNESEPFSWDDIGEEESFITRVVIAPLCSEMHEDEGVLEDESEYTDDHNEEVEVSEDNEKEVAAAQNDEMDTPSEDVSDEP